MIPLWTRARCSVACGCAFFAVGGHGAAGLAMLSAGLVCAGLTILLFFGCMGAMKGILRLTKKITLWTKDRFIKKEDVQ